jgi:hypothetical protein
MAEMTGSDEFLTVDDRNLDEVRDANLGALILTTSDCDHCVQYQAEIAALRERGRLREVVIGKMVLDRPGSAGFKRDNPWLAGLKNLPHTLVYQRGAKVDEFSASRGAYLLERIDDLRQPSSND